MQIFYSLLLFHPFVSLSLIQKQGEAEIHGLRAYQEQGLNLLHQVK